MLIINSSHCIPAMVSAGVCHTVLLRSDGGAIAKGNIEDGQCDIPPLDDGLAYTKVAAGRGHTVLLCSDGSAVAIGENDFGQCNIPPLVSTDMRYTQVSAGYLHTVLL
jgi:alpha-tubulin suppressor-like RCC1 family protein